METTFLITGIFFLILGCFLIGLSLYKPTFKYSRSIQWIGGFFVTLGVFFLVVHFETKVNDSSYSWKIGKWDSCNNTKQNRTVVCWDNNDKKEVSDSFCPSLKPLESKCCGKTCVTPVLIGVALAESVASPNSNKILLSQIIDKIDIFWDWLPEYTGKLYDVKENDTVHDKYVPMKWGKGPASEYMKKYPKYVFSWNEPDMLGTIINGTGTSTSYGFWTADPFPYGNAIEGGILDKKHDDMLTNTTYKKIAKDLYDEATQLKKSRHKVQLGTPVTAMAADISRGCAGMKPINKGMCGQNLVMSTVTVAQTCGDAPCTGCNTKNCNGMALDESCQETCWLNTSSSTKKPGCTCNGWLDLVKSADQRWWDMTDFINIHCYHRIAHMVKLHILEYMYVFKEDVQSGKKKIWLSECACIYTSADIINSSPEEVSANFVRDLLWNTTDASNVGDTCKNLLDSYTKYGVPSSLPGLRTWDTFTFQGKTGSWYDHGFGAFTWFTAKDFPGFGTGCKDEFAPTINSNIWSNEQPNDVFSALTGRST